MGPLVTLVVSRGTSGSTPASSSGESAANSEAALIAERRVLRTRLSQSRHHPFLLHIVGTDLVGSAQHLGGIPYRPVIH